MMLHGLRNVRSNHKLHRKLSLHTHEQQNQIVAVVRGSKPHFSSPTKGNPRFGGAIVGAKAQDHMLGLGLYPRTQIGPRIKKWMMKDPRTKPHKRKQMSGRPRSTYSSDLMSIVQNIYNATFKVTFREDSVTGMHFTNMGKGGRFENIWKKTDTTTLNLETATLLAAFMWRRRLNSVTLANATHRGPGKVADGTSTQVRVQMINKCRVKMNYKGLYKLGDSP